MGITLPSDQLELTLDAAVRLAEGGEAVPQIWLNRVARIGESPSKSYVAALGTALLAKATDARIDALSVKAKAGPTAYSMRGVVKVLVQKAPTYGYHLGVTKREPLNNQPWFGADRVDRMPNVKKDALPFHRDLVRYLSDLNGLSEPDALAALAAFLRVRLEFAKENREAAEQLRVVGGSHLEDLLEVTALYLQGDTDGGRRGQALVAAAFDLAHDDVKLAAINDPTSIDVTVRGDRKDVIAVEVKQKPVEESDALGVAAEAARRGIDKSLLVAIAPTQRPLDTERIRRKAEADHGVLALTVDSVMDFICLVALNSEISAREFSERFPARYLERLREHGVSPPELQYWVDLCATLAR
jgi:SacI restriction endonuclease